MSFDNKELIALTQHEIRKNSHKTKLVDKKKFYFFRMAFLATYFMKLFKNDLSKAFEMQIFAIASLFFRFFRFVPFRERFAVRGALRGLQSLRVRP